MIDYIFRGIAAAVEAGAIRGKCHLLGTIYRELVKMRKQSGKVWVSPRRLANRVGCSERTIYRALVELRQLGLIEKRRRSWRGTWVMLAQQPMTAIAATGDAAAEQVLRRRKTVPWYRALAEADQMTRRTVRAWLGQSCHDDTAMNPDTIFFKSLEDRPAQKGSLANRAARLGIKINT